MTEEISFLSSQVGQEAVNWFVVSFGSSEKKFIGLIITLSDDHACNIACRSVLHYGVGLKKNDSWDQPRTVDIPPYQKCSIGSGYADTDFISLNDLNNQAESEFCPVSVFKDAIRERLGLSSQNDLERTKCVVFVWQAGCVPLSVQFCIHDMMTDKWIKLKSNNNFVVSIPSSTSVSSTPPYSAEKEFNSSTKWMFGSSSEIEVFLFKSNTYVILYFETDHSVPLLLHFGSKDSGQWAAMASGTVNASAESLKSDLMNKMIIECSYVPKEDILVCSKFNATANRINFKFSDSRKKQQCVLIIHGGAVMKKFVFVLKEQNFDKWFKLNGQSDFELEIPQMKEWEEEKKNLDRLIDSVETEKKEKEEKNKLLWSAAKSEFGKISTEQEKESGVFVSRWELTEDQGIVSASVSCPKNLMKMDSLESQCENMKSLELQPSIITVQLDFCLKSDCLLHWGLLPFVSRSVPSSPSESDSPINPHQIQTGGQIRSSPRRRLLTGWKCPPKDLQPQQTHVVDPEKAAQTLLPPLLKSDDRKEISSDDHIINFFKRLILIYPVNLLASDGSMIVAPDFGGLSFVLKEVGSDRWFKDLCGTDMVVKFNTSGGPTFEGGGSDLASRIIEMEVDWHHMTLMHRYQNMNDFVNKWDSNQKNEVDDLEFWSWILVWARFSQLNWVDWQRNYNTKPVDLAWAANSCSRKLSELWKKYPKYRSWIRMILPTVGRGAANGQAIRDRILDIMKKNNISERYETFYEQWHQKLHNNTTPDDIGLCRAVIRYLESGGNLGEYYRVLKDHNIDRDKLMSYERKIRSEPYMVDNPSGFISDLKGYLDILLDVHDSVDLRKSAEKVSHLLSNVSNDLWSIVNDNRNGHLSFYDSSNKIKKISYVRENILRRAEDINLDSGSVRDLLLLDMALESQESLIFQQAEKTSGQLSDFVDVINKTLITISARNPTNEQWRMVTADWNKFAGPCSCAEYTSDVIEDSLLLKALSDRLFSMVGDHVNEMQELLGPKSEFLGHACNIDNKSLITFVDEILRGSALFGISTCLKRVEAMIRERAQLPPWQIISRNPKVSGVLKSFDKLVGMQHMKFDVPTIIICGAVSGEEEIPEGVNGVLVRDSSNSPDILSHCAVRARNEKALLAVCFDYTIVAQIEKLVNEVVDVTLSSDNLSVTKKSQNTPLSASSTPTTASASAEVISQVMSKADKQNNNKLINLTENPSADFVIPSSQFTPITVGSKSLNLSKLADLKLNGFIVPRAVALPYGCMQKTLSSITSKMVLPDLQKLVSKIDTGKSNEKIEKIFKKFQLKFDELDVPPELLKSLNSEITSIESNSSSQISMIELLTNCGTEGSWTAIKKVWSSMFALRPWVSLNKAHRSFSSLMMAVLVQELFDARYAFVLHSRNPFSTEDENRKEREMYGELVLGLGEVLVSNTDGRALSWTMKENGKPHIIAFPSKKIALFGEACLIFRSDSNGEDLEGFAGAGLFESVPGKQSIQKNIGFTSEPIIEDRSFRYNLMEKIAKISFDIEDAFGDAMDIEGVVFKDGSIGIVQARPQV